LSGALLQHPCWYATDALADLLLEGLNGVEEVLAERSPFRTALASLAGRTTNLASTIFGSCAFGESNEQDASCGEIT